MTILIKPKTSTYSSLTQSYRVGGSEKNHIEYSITGEHRHRAGLVQAELFLKSLTSNPSKSLETLKQLEKEFYDGSIWYISELLLQIFPRDEQQQQYPLLWRDFQGLKHGPDKKSFYCTFSALDPSIATAEDLLKVREEIIASYGLDWTSARGLSSLLYLWPGHEAFETIPRALEIKKNHLIQDSEESKEDIVKRIIMVANNMGLETVQQKVLNTSDGKINLTKKPFIIQSAEWVGDSGNPKGTLTYKGRLPKNAEENTPTSFTWQLPKATNRKGKPIDEGGQKQGKEVREQSSLVLASYPPLRLIRESRGEFLSPELRKLLTELSFSTSKKDSVLIDVFNMFLSDGNIKSHLITFLKNSTGLASNFPSKEQIQENTLPEEKVLLRDEITGRIVGINPSFIPENETQEITFTLLQKAWEEIKQRGLKVEELNPRKAEKLIRSLNGLSDEVLAQPESEKNLREALKLAPENEQALNQLAQCLYLQGNREESKAVCTRLIALGHASAYEMRAQGRLEDGELRAALEDLNKAIEYFPDNTSLYAGRANISLLLNEYNNESYAFWSDCNEVINKGNSGDKAFVHLIQTMVYQSMAVSSQDENTRRDAFQSALSSINTAIDLEPTVSASHECKIELCLKMDDLPAAQEVARLYESDFALREKKPEYYLVMGSLEETLGQKAKACQQYQTALMTGETAPLEVYYKLANIYSSDGDTSRAEVLFHQFLNEAKSPRWSENIYSKNKFQPLINRAEKALKEYNPDQYVRKALSELEQEIVKKTIPSADTSESKRLFDTARTAYSHMKDYPTAIDRLRQSMALNPFNVSSSVVLARFFKEVDPVESIRLATKAILVLEQHQDTLSDNEKTELENLYSFVETLSKEIGAFNVAKKFQEKDLGNLIN